ncbi:MAG TPA: porin [Steroidobacteraceae bacterium]|nr:porin [Steroidobacteraceae bacterium]
MRLGVLVRILASMMALAAMRPAIAQQTLQSGRYTLTTEGCVNITSAIGDGFIVGAAGDLDDVRADLALRLLGQFKNDNGPDLGLRLVVESSPEDRLDLAEASVLLFGSHGRLEIGDRQGLPDVLTGYAPNNFSFTGAEFGPASGPSLDPGGGLQHAFVPAALAAQLNELSVLGASATLANDRSAKAVYVSPKSHGFLAGLSYAVDADDPRFGSLAQAGLVHEKYWDSNILRLGGSASLASGTDRATTRVRDLHSVNVGATLILNYDLMLGISGTWNGSSGTVIDSASPATSGAFGITTSVNYNRGRWTYGGYLQSATSEGDVRLPGNDRLTAMEVGASYRLNTKFRVYAAWYRFEFSDDGERGEWGRTDGNQFLFGLRAAL